MIGLLLEWNAGERGMKRRRVAAVGSAITICSRRVFCSTHAGNVK